MELYSRTVVDHFMAPRYTAPLPRVDGQGEANSPDPDCPDHVRFFVQIEGSTVQGAQQTTEGCVATVAAASCLAEAVVGQGVDAARGITVADLKARLEDVPGRHRYCLDVPIEALHRALDAANARP